MGIKESGHTADHCANKFPEFCGLAKLFRTSRLYKALGCCTLFSKNINFLKTFSVVSSVQLKLVVAPHVEGVCCSWMLLFWTEEWRQQIRTKMTLSSVDQPQQQRSGRSTDAQIICLSGWFLQSLGGFLKVALIVLNLMDKTHCHCWWLNYFLGLTLTVQELLSKDRREERGW